jgi:hypothetical protein
MSKNKKPKNKKPKDLAASDGAGVDSQERGGEPSAFVQADRISDRIVDILNEERTKPGFNPVQAFAGQLLAILSFARTAPVPRPQPMANPSAPDLAPPSSPKTKGDPA